MEPGERLNQISEKIIGATLEVRRRLVGIRRLGDDFPDPLHLSAVSAFQAVPKEDE